MRKLIQQLSTELHTYLRRLHRECLIGALCVDFEGLCTAQNVLEVVIALIANVLKVLFAYTGAAVCGDTEYLTNSVCYLAKIDIIIEWSYICRGLSAGHLKVTKRFQSALYVLYEHILKGLFIETFECHFSVFNKYQLFHIFSPILLYIYKLLSSNLFYALTESLAEYINLLFSSFSSHADTQCAVCTLIFNAELSENSALLSF